MCKRKANRISRISASLSLFAAGGSLYYLLEILLRGFSHWSMILCGGICLILIDGINRRFPEAPLLVRASLGALLITAVELAAGYLFNIRLGMAIWDYSGHTAHLWGQISPFASARWFLLCIPVCVGCEWVESRVFGG